MMKMSRARNLEREDGEASRVRVQSCIAFKTSANLDLRCEDDHGGYVVAALILGKVRSVRTIVAHALGRQTQCLHGKTHGRHHEGPLDVLNYPNSMHRAILKD
jgi:hypothetical protein